MVAIIFFIVIIAAIVLIMVGAMRGSGRKGAQVRQASYVTPAGEAIPDSFPAAPGQQAPGQQMPDQWAYRQGVSHRSNATVFGIIGLFVLGIVFGPLAIAQANKAEVFGVRATAGKVLGAISLVFTILWVLFIFLGGFIRG